MILNSNIPERDGLGEFLTLSFSFVPVVEKQIPNPAEEYWILAGKASIIRPPSDQAKAYDRLFFGEGEHCWDVGERPILEVL